jgi:GxxExxY protein
VNREELNKLSEQIIGAAIAVHRELGPGLLESVYETCLAMELRRIGLSVQAQQPVPVNFRGQSVSEDGLRLDLLVADRIIVEIKSVEPFHPVHKKQLLTYLRLANKPLGLLINFNVPLLKDGIERIINTPSVPSVVSV